MKSLNKTETPIFLSVVCSLFPKAIFFTFIELRGVVFIFLVTKQIQTPHHWCYVGTAPNNPRPILTFTKPSLGWIKPWAILNPHVIRACWCMSRSDICLYIPAASLCTIDQCQLCALSYRSLLVSAGTPPLFCPVALLQLIPEIWWISFINYFPCDCTHVSQPLASTCCFIMLGNFNNAILRLAIISGGLNVLHVAHTILT